jgi:hypothetical protein
MAHALILPALEVTAGRVGVDGERRGGEARGAGVRERPGEQGGGNAALAGRSAGGPEATRCVRGARPEVAGRAPTRYRQRPTGIALLVENKSKSARTIYLSWANLVRTRAGAPLLQ